MPYCRRTQTRLRTRQRSCRACSAAKAKCTFQSTCHRCLRKEIECVYDIPTATNKRFRAAVAASTMDNTTTPNHTESSSLPLDSGWAGSEVSVDDDIDKTGLPWAYSNHARHHEYYTPDSLSVEPEVVAGNGRAIDPKDRLAILVPGQEGPVPEVPFVTPLVNQYLESSTVSPAWTSQDEYSPDLSILPEISMPTSPHFLERHQMQNPIAEHSAKLAIQMLRSFPRMMARRATFPPFIHPYQYTPNNTSSKLPTPLANCMGIAHMLESQTFETKSFVWQTIRAEQHRFQREVSPNKSFLHSLLVP